MLWGGRFSEKTDEAALRFSSSFRFDFELMEEDIKVSSAHAEMLAKTGIISVDEAANIKAGLAAILGEWKSGAWKPGQDDFEDVHSAIESRLFEKIGTDAGRLHSGRSRNDLVASSFKLWIKKASESLSESIKTLQMLVLSIAESHTETIMPGFTHLQRAQPVSFAFHLLSYYEMLERDLQRFSANCSNFQSPLGAGAMAGSTLPLDRQMTASLLGFGTYTENALDTVADRDFVLDFLHSSLLCMMHLSRLSEELILWSGSEWRFIRLGDKFTTGSSLMPQKKNPDMAELIRGKSGRVYGNYISLAVTMKGLPMSYNRDMQEDKEPAFDTFRTLKDSLSIMQGMLATMTVNKGRFIDELDYDFSLATDMADWLVSKGMPFREAHETVGIIVKLAESRTGKFDCITLSDLREINSIFDESALECFRIRTALGRKKTAGSPNPQMLKQRIEILKNRTA